MRRFVAALTVLGVTVPMLVATHASAHTDWHVAGYQYVTASLEGVASGGYLNTPAGPVPITDGVVDDGIGSITNRDPIGHTFTECTADCDTGTPSWEGAAFDVELPATSSASGADVDALNLVFEGNAGEWIVLCRVHPAFMRARLSTTGA